MDRKKNLTWYGTPWCIAVRNAFSVREDPPCYLSTNPSPCAHFMPASLPHPRSQHGTELIFQGAAVQPSLASAVSLSTVQLSVEQKSDQTTLCNAWDVWIRSVRTVFHAFGQLKASIIAKCLGPIILGSDVRASFADGWHELATKSLTNHRSTMSELICHSSRLHTPDSIG